MSGGKRIVSEGDSGQWQTLDDLLGLDAIADAAVAGAGIGKLAFYGRARTLLPDTRIALEHPPTVYVREEQLTGPINAWIAGLFSLANLEDTVIALAGADEDDPAEARITTARQRIAAAEATKVRSQRALEAGWDPEGSTSW
jgi:hypothetical protein